MSTRIRRRAAAIVLMATATGTVLASCASGTVATDDAEREAPAPADPTAAPAAAAALYADSTTAMTTAALDTKLDPGQATAIAQNLKNSWGMDNPAHDTPGLITHRFAEFSCPGAAGLWNQLVRRPATPEQVESMRGTYYTVEHLHVDDRHGTYDLMANYPGADEPEKVAGFILDSRKDGTWETCQIGPNNGS